MARKKEERGVSFEPEQASHERVDGSPHYDQRFIAANEDKAAKLKTLYWETRRPNWTGRAFIIIALAISAYLFWNVLGRFGLSSMPAEFLLPFIVVAGAVLAVLLSSYAFGPRQR